VLVCVTVTACADTGTTIAPAQAPVSSVALPTEPTDTELESTTTESSTTQAPALVTSTTAVRTQDELQLVCDGIPLPGDDADLGSLPPMDADGEDAWAAAAAKYGVDMRLDHDWRILNRTATDMLFITETEYGDILSSRFFTIASFTRSGDSWSAGDMTNCGARWGAEGRLNVDVLEIDPAHRAASDSSVLHLVFGDDGWPCGSADAASALVQESAESVSIVVTVESATDPTALCPAGLTPITVQLDAPLGDRTVVDGSTESPRALTLFRPQQRLHVAFAGASVLGWWDADAEVWVDADTTSSALPVSPGTTFAVVALDGPRPDVRAGTVMRDCEPAQTWTVALDPAIDWGDQTLAVDADWPLLPRLPTTLSATIPDYADAVSAYLADNGLPDVPVLVEQVIRVDLDGDGTDEVLVTARHPDAGTSLGAQAGHHSVVLLRRVVGAGVETTALFQDLHLQPDVDYPSMLTGRVMAVGDLNGDGTMEVAIEWHYFEGSGVDIIDLATGTPQKVLTTGCGS
jgi:hypothetical protein